MKKRIKIVKQGEDDSNILYWLSLTGSERMTELEKTRQRVNKRFYPDQTIFQKVYCIIQRTTNGEEVIRQGEANI